MAGYGMVGLQPQGDDCNTSDHHSLSSVNVKYFTVQSVDCCRSYGIFVRKILHGESPCAEGLISGRRFFVILHSLSCGFRC